MYYASQTITYRQGKQISRVRVGGDLDSRKFRAFIFTSDSVTIVGDFSRVIDAHRGAMRFITKGGCYADG